MSLYEGAEDAKRVLSADKMNQMALLFGALDENVETVQQRTGARIRAMGTEITVTGTQEQADLAATVLEKLIATLRKGEKIDKSRINYAVELAKEGQADQIDADHAGRRGGDGAGAAGALQNAGPEEIRKGGQGEHGDLCGGAGGNGQDVPGHGHGGCGL